MRAHTHTCIREQVSQQNHDKKKRQKQPRISIPGLRSGNFIEQYFSKGEKDNICIKKTQSFDISSSMVQIKVFTRGITAVFKLLYERGCLRHCRGRGMTLVSLFRLRAGISRINI